MYLAYKPVFLRLRTILCWRWNGLKHTLDVISTQVADHSWCAYKYLFLLCDFLTVIMAALCKSQTIIFLPCGFYLLLLSIFFPRLISAATDWMSTILRGVATASPVRPTMSPYIKMTTDSLSSELTFDEWRGVILQRIVRPTLLLHVIHHYTTYCFFNNFAIRRPYLLS